MPKNSKLEPNPKIVLPPVREYAIPLEITIVPRVTMNGGILNLATIIPLAKPISPPAMTVMITIMGDGKIGDRVNTYQSILHNEISKQEYSRESRDSSNRDPDHP